MKVPHCAFKDGDWKWNALKEKQMRIEQILLRSALSHTNANSEKQLHSPIKLIVSVIVSVYNWKKTPDDLRTFCATVRQTKRDQ